VRSTSQTNFAPFTEAEVSLPCSQQPAYNKPLHKYNRALSPKISFLLALPLSVKELGLLDFYAPIYVCIALSTLQPAKRFSPEVL
jgi:hypothetical protein